jgi:hypothetical protein
VPHPADGAYVLRIGGEVNRANTGKAVELTGSVALAGLPAMAPVPSAAPPAPAPAVAAPVVTHLTLTAGRVTTRTRTVRVRLSADGALTRLRARLFRGRGPHAALVANRTLPRLAATGTVALRPRSRLRPGPHVIEVTAVDADGKPVRATAVLVVRR